MERDVYRLFLAVAAVPSLLLLVLEFYKLRHIQVFQQVEICVLLLAMLLAAVNYLRVTELVSEVMAFIEQHVRPAPIIPQVAKAMMFHYLLAVLAFTLCIAQIIYGASPFVILGLIFCIYVTFVHSNLCVLDLLATSVNVENIESDWGATYRREYVSLGLTNLHFLRSENLPTCFGYFLLLVVCLLGQYFDNRMTRETLHAFAGGAATVHLVTSTLRFNQVIRNSSEEPLHKKDVLDMVMEIFQQDDPAHMNEVTGVCCATVKARLYSQNTLTLVALLASGVGIALYGTIVMSPS